MAKFYNWLGLLLFLINGSIVAMEQSYHAKLRQSLWAKRREALAAALHPRLGSQSPASNVPQELMLAILRLSEYETDARLLKAVNKPNINTAKILALIAAGANPNARDEEGDTAMHDLVIHWYLSPFTDWSPRDDARELEYRMIPFNALLNAGANPNAAANKGNTPLFDACTLSVIDRKRYSICIQKLLAIGADPWNRQIKTIRARDYSDPASLFRCPSPGEVEPEILAILAKERAARLLAFVCASHPRLGSETSAQRLPQELFQYITKLVSAS